MNRDAQPVHVLFVGNSYTYYNNFLHLVMHIFSRSTLGCRPLRMRALLQGGVGLHEHAAEFGEVLSERVDAVVLQDHSQNPGGFHQEDGTAADGQSPDGARRAATMSLLESVYAPALRRWQAGREATPSPVVLLSTWPRPRADPECPRHYPDASTMNAKVAAGYRGYRDVLVSAGVARVSVARCGDAFVRAMEQHKIAAPVLYAAEDNRAHPSPAGSVLAAYVVGWRLMRETLGKLCPKKPQPLLWNNDVPAVEPTLGKRLMDIALEDIE